MSTLYVDNLQPNLGSGVHIAGHVIQVATTSVQGNITTTTSAFVDTGISLSFTPKSAISKLIITLQGGRPYIYGGQQQDVKLFQDGSQIGSTTDARWEALYSQTGGIHVAHSAMYVLNADSTTARTYSVKFRTNTGTTYFNNENAADDEYDVWFTVMEIAQ